MFLSRNKENNVYPCKPQFYYIKVGFKGSKLCRHVFVMWDWKARLYSIVNLLDPWTKGLLRDFIDITILYSPTSSPLVQASNNFVRSLIQGTFMGLYRAVNLLDPWSKGLLWDFTNITILYKPKTSLLVQESNQFDRFFNQGISVGLNRTVFVESLTEELLFTWYDKPIITKLIYPFCTVQFHKTG